MFFQLAARLAWQTNNQTYVEWAGKVWGWSEAVRPVQNDPWSVKDSTSTENHCGGHHAHAEELCSWCGEAMQWWRGWNALRATLVPGEMGWDGEYDGAGERDESLCGVLYLVRERDAVGAIQATNDDRRARERESDGDGETGGGLVWEGQWWLGWWE
ncbi:hypothetical protein BDV59DRAFT_169089 [Aspergillus ambiguus]|uniref:uncharacterized protein n=1 Tax=Aspergillus ambiguus TaxID=176160 RepID=UPI003CCDD467